MKKCWAALDQLIVLMMLLMSSLTMALLPGRRSCFSQYSELSRFLAWSRAASAAAYTDLSAGKEAVSIWRKNLSASGPPHCLEPWDESPWAPQIVRQPNCNGAMGGTDLCQSR
eukprot:scaffold98889_cov17-Tisochrysis_lutea.AAC.6